MMRGIHRYLILLIPYCLYTMLPNTVCSGVLLIKLMFVNDVIVCNYLNFYLILILNYGIMECVILFVFDLCEWSVFRF